MIFKDSFTHNFFGERGCGGDTGEWADPYLKRLSCYFLTIKNCREYDYCHIKIRKIYVDSALTFFKENENAGIP